MTATEAKEIQQKKETQLGEGVEPARQGRLFLPATDILETNDTVVLTAEMPGVRPDGVEITLERNVLTVRGQVAEEHQRDEPAYAEYEVGNYERTFSLSHEIDRDGIEAKVRDGVLTLTLPKVAPTQRKIEVRAD